MKTIFCTVEGKELLVYDREFNLQKGNIVKIEDELFIIERVLFDSNPFYTYYFVKKEN